MANRNYPSQRTFGFHMLPVRIDGNVAIGSTGAVGALESKGVAAITRLAVGIYRIQLEDNYYQFCSLNARMQSPVTGSAVAGGSFSAGTVYQIITLGTTTQAQWITAGVPAGITAAVGVIFKAAAVGAGTGTVKALGPSGINTIELLGNPELTLNKQPFTSGSGGYITIQCLGPTSSSVTTQIPTDPASGSVLWFDIMLNNSSVQ